MDSAEQAPIWGSAVPDPAKQDLLALKARWVLENLPDSAKPRILDFGFGQGKFSQLVRNHRPDADLVGVDVETPQETHGLAFHLVEADGTLPLADNQFDAAVSCDVLEHVDSIELALQEISRVLKPGGRFVGNVPLEGGWRPHSLFRLIDRDLYKDTKDHQHNYTESEILGYFSKDFQIDELGYSYHFFGGFLDAAFFASFKLPVIGPKMQDYFWGQENSFYREQDAAQQRSLVGTLAEFAHTLSYFESRALRRVSLGACAIHFRLSKRLDT